MAKEKKEMINLPPYLDDSYVLLPRDRYDCCIVGYTDTKEIVYSYSKIIELLEELDGMTNDEAIDFFYYNMNDVPVIYVFPIEN